MTFVLEFQEIFIIVVSFYSFFQLLLVKSFDHVGWLMVGSLLWFCPEMSITGVWNKFKVFYISAHPIVQPVRKYCAQGSAEQGWDAKQLSHLLLAQHLSHLVLATHLILRFLSPVECWILGRFSSSFGIIYEFMTT